MAGAARVEFEPAGRNRVGPDFDLVVAGGREVNAEKGIIGVRDRINRARDVLGDRGVEVVLLAAKWEDPKLFAYRRGKQFDGGEAGAGYYLAGEQ